MVNKKLIIKQDYEHLIPWIIGTLVVLIVFPYDRIKEQISEYFTPEPIIQYVEVPVPQYIYIEKPKEPEPIIKEEKVIEPIVCVFDIANTLTDGTPNRCIKMCKDMGCRLAINTNRDINNCHDLGLPELGFEKPYFNDEEDYFYNANAKTSTFEDAAQNKLANMNSIMNKNGIIDPKRLILIESNKINIDTVKDKGYSGILVGTKNPGIQEEDIRKIHEIIVSLTE